jgi:hypothetical protein
MVIPPESHRLAEPRRGGELHPPPQHAASVGKHDQRATRRENAEGYLRRRENGITCWASRVHGSSYVDALRPHAARPIAVITREPWSRKVTLPFVISQRRGIQQTVEKLPQIFVAESRRNGHGAGIWTGEAHDRDPQRTAVDNALCRSWRRSHNRARSHCRNPRPG